MRVNAMKRWGMSALVLVAGCAAPRSPGGQAAALSRSGAGAGAPAPAPALALPAEPRGLTQARASNDGAYFVEYRSAVSPIPLNEPFDLSIVVADGRDHRPVSDVVVNVEARMPAHYHGMNRRVEVTPRGNGVFTAEGLLFHMPGAWELYIDIRRGSVTERAQFDIDIQ